MKESEPDPDLVMWLLTIMLRSANAGFFVGVIVWLDNDPVTSGVSVFLGWTIGQLFLSAVGDDP